MFRIVEPEVALVELGRAPVEPRAGPGSVVVPLEPLVISGIQWTKTLVLQRYLWPPDQPGPPGKICPGTKILGLFLFLTATPNTKYTLIMILQQLQIERWHHTLHLGCDHHD